MRRILAIDTSGPSGIVAVSDGTRQRNIRFDSISRTGAHLGDYAVRLLDEIGLEIGNLTNLAAGIGPGKFIRTRVGISFINGLAAATGLPITQVDSLAVLGYSCVADVHSTGAVREENRGRVIAAHGLADTSAPHFNPAKPWKNPPKLISPEDLLEPEYEHIDLWAVDGDGSETPFEDKFAIDIRAAHVFGEAKARYLIKLALEGIKRNCFVKFATPLYHKPAV
ncbi:tRNA (adenosine(37)-N6)-threonylcarbamoyltransferase complex dimerization subunit type 1 TsaB [bacterium]|nr:tRNA (adenosine(37)-N6)-threonylcarbamoyltransferase complex dimerization subunit type 1 TsaB [bacterium]